MAELDKLDTYTLGEASGLPGKVALRPFSLLLGREN